MNRRGFLKALGAVLAATAVDPQALFAARPVGVPVAAPVIDWTAWNVLELKSGPAGVMGCINGYDVTPFPELMRMLARFIRVDPDTQSVAFGTVDCALGSGIRFEVPQLDAKHDIVIAASVKLSDHIISKMTIDGSGRHPAKDMRPCGETVWMDEVRIQTVLPTSKPNFTEWTPRFSPTDPRRLPQ